MIVKGQGGTMRYAVLQFTCSAGVGAEGEMM